MTVKLEGGQTNICIKNKLFRQCSFLILNLPGRELGRFDDINSIDEVVEIINKKKLGSVLEHYRMDPEVEFFGHCSNLQAWYESGYDTRVLHSNLSFPLLLELVRAGDPLAIRSYKDEIASRFASGSSSVVEYILQEGYLNYLSNEELESLFLSLDSIPLPVSNEARLILLRLLSSINLEDKIVEAIIEILMYLSKAPNDFFIQDLFQILKRIGPKIDDDSFLIELVNVLAFNYLRFNGARELLSTIKSFEYIFNERDVREIIIEFLRKIILDYPDSVKGVDSQNEIQLSKHFILAFYKSGYFEIFSQELLKIIENSLDKAISSFHGYNYYLEPLGAMITIFQKYPHQEGIRALFKNYLRIVLDDMIFQLERDAHISRLKPQVFFSFSLLCKLIIMMNIHSTLEEKVKFVFMSLFSKLLHNIKGFNFESFNCLLNSVPSTQVMDHIFQDVIDFILKLDFTISCKCFNVFFEVSKSFGLISNKRDILMSYIRKMMEIAKNNPARIILLYKNILDVTQDTELFEDLSFSFIDALNKLDLDRQIVGLEILLRKLSDSKIIIENQCHKFSKLIKLSEKIFRAFNDKCIIPLRECYSLELTDESPEKLINLMISCFSMLNNKIKKK
ncbi:MAG: hypothetical protein ACTSPH_06710 [Promethearchaeota archaeon]